jgi:hypothetical protein
VVRVAGDGDLLGRRRGRRPPRRRLAYERPTAGYQLLRGAVAFHPGRVQAPTVGGEPVRAQAGDFYGGWITADVVGPFTGERARSAGYPYPLGVCSGA